MRVSVNQMRNFLKKCFVGGIENARLSFKEDGLHVNVIEHLTKTGAISGFMPKSCFQDYVPMEAYVRDTLLLLKVLGNMDDSGIVSISTIGKVLVLNDGSTKAELIMPQAEYVPFALPDAGAEKLFGLFNGKEAGFEIDAYLLSKMQKGAAMVGANSVRVSTVGGVLSMTTGDKEFDKLTYEVPVPYKDASALYCPILLEFIKDGAMSGKLTVQFDTDYPMLITSRDVDGVVVVWLASPLKEEEEEAEDAAITG